MTLDHADKISAQNVIKRSNYWFVATGNEGIIDLPSDSDLLIRRSNNISDYIWRFDVNDLTENSVVFCKVDYLNMLHQYLVSCKCDQKFILVTGQSDFAISEQLATWFLDNHDVNWYSTNSESTKVKPFPLGIANDFCPITLKTFNTSDHSKLVYMNHRVETYPSTRRRMYDKFSNESWVTVEHPSEKGTFDSYKLGIETHKYMFCPRGNGIDTHRLWECLYSGVVPIVERHYTHSNLEGLLPILFVDSYDEVTEELLETSWESFDKNPFPKALHVDFWMKYMRGNQNAS